MFDINSKSEYYMNTFQIKPFKSYDEALAHYNNVKPIRKTEVRPLGSRRHHSSASIVLDEATGDVHLYYISKPFVIWHKAGGITVNAPLHTQALLCTRYTTTYLTLCSLGGIGRVSLFK